MGVKWRCQANEMCFGTENISFVYMKAEDFLEFRSKSGTLYGNFQKPQICGLKKTVTKKNDCKRISSYGIFWCALPS